MSRKVSTANLGLIGRAAARSASLFNVEEGKSYRELTLDQVIPNPEQPRTHFDAATLAELAESIRAHGVLQPILVRESSPDTYEIIAGERRFRASQAAGRATIPAIVTSTDDPAVLALLENIQREDLEPFDLARFLARLQREHGATHDQLAALIGKSRPYVTRVLGLLRLPDDIAAEAPGHRHVSLSLLMEIAEAEDAATQRALWQRAKAGTTVKALRQAKQQTPSSAPEQTPLPGDPLLRASQRFGRALARARRGSGLDDSHVEALKALRRDIDVLLGEEER